MQSKGGVLSALGKHEQFFVLVHFDFSMIVLLLYQMYHQEEKTERDEIQRMILSLKHTESIRKIKNDNFSNFYCFSIFLLFANRFLKAAFMIIIGLRIVCLLSGTFCAIFKLRQIHFVNRSKELEVLNRAGWSIPE